MLLRLRAAAADVGLHVDTMDTRFVDVFHVNIHWILLPNFEAER